MMTLLFYFCNIAARNETTHRMLRFAALILPVSYGVVVVAMFEYPE
jgi:hypothetical protein